MAVVDENLSGFIVIFPIVGDEIGGHGRKSHVPTIGAY
jgi:hypothetical protein